MKTRFAGLLLILGLVACTEQPAAPPPPAVPVASAAVPPEGVGPGRWDVEQVRCSDLLGAADADRASAAMFYYGYLAAQTGIHIIDVSRIDGNIAKVMQQCAAAPNLTVPEAFRQALRPQS
jgi:HdeA/HdeB family